MLKLGRLELIELDDEWTMKIASRLMKKARYREQFVRIDRSDKYIICRVATKNPLHLYNPNTKFEPYLKTADRKTFVPGDLRICWYQAVCTVPVAFLAQ